MSRLEFVLAELPDRGATGPQDIVDIADLDVASSKSATISLDGSHSASFTLDGNDPVAKKIIPLLTDVVVKLDGEPISRCRIGPRNVEDDDSGGQRVTFTAWSYKEMLARRFILPGDKVSYVGLDTEEAAWNLVNLTQTRAGADSRMGINRGDSQFTGVPTTFVGAVGNKIADAISTIIGASSQSGDTQIPSWDIDPYMSFKVYYPMIGNATATYTAAYGTEVLHYKELFDPSNFANFIQVVGGSPPSPAPPLQPAPGSYTVDIDADPVGVIEAFFSESDLLSDAAVLSRTVWYLNKMGIIRPSYSLVLDPEHWDAGQLWIGDFLNVEINHGCLEVQRSDLRTTEITLSEDDADTFTVSITAGYKQPNIIDKFNQTYSMLRTVSAGVTPSSVTVTGISPAAIVHGTTVTVTITGTGFSGSDSLAPEVSISGTGIDVSAVTWVSSTTLNATVAVDAGAIVDKYNVTVNNPISGSGTGVNILSVT